MWNIRAKCGEKVDTWGEETGKQKEMFIYKCKVTSKLMSTSSAS